jgi:class 3 adenylate cyclase
MRSVSGIGRIAALGAVIAAIALVAIVLFGGGDGGYTVTVRFLNGGQLVKGNPVQAGGVPIGSVEDIKITDDGQAAVRMKIDGDHAPLREGTRAQIKQFSQSGIAFTISLELTVLVARSVLRPVDDLLRATEHVKRGDLDARVPVISGDEMGELAGSFNEMMRGLAERESLREALRSYVNPDVARRVLDEGELLEGRDVEVTVMFVDLVDFTPFAERRSARETVVFLNEFFDLAVPIVQRHRGHANKFLGDGLLGVFGAPERVDDYADCALAAAVEIVRAVDERWDGEVRVGAGINSGPVVVGSMGGGGRLDFTVIGDRVNTAARVERATRETATRSSSPTRLAACCATAGATSNGAGSSR